MASVNQKRFEDENLVIVSSNTEIDMTQWRKYLIENWNKVFFPISILSLLFFVRIMYNIAVLHLYLKK